MEDQSQTAKPRVAFLLLDGVELDSVNFFREEGLMPNTERLLSGGQFVRLDSRDNYSAEMTPTEMITGQTAEESGYWGIVGFDPKTYECDNVGAYRGPAFYDRPDMRSIVFDVPHMRIDPSTPGVHVAAWGAHSPQFPRSSNPSQLILDLEAEFGTMHAPHFEDIHASHNVEWGRTLTDHMLESLDKRPKVVSWLMEREADWDFLLIGATETHVHEHAFHHTVEPDHELYSHPTTQIALGYMRELFIAVDQMVGEVEALLPENTQLLIGAMHGAKPSAIDTSSILAGELVYRDQTGKTLVELPLKLDGPVEMEPELRARGYIQRYKRRPGPAHGHGVKAQAMHYLRWASHRYTPGRIEHKLERLSRRLQGLQPEWWVLDPTKPITEAPDLSGPLEIVPIETEPSLWYRHDWPTMRFFVIPSFSSLQIRVNLVGREADGIVPASEYEAALDEAETLINAMTNAITGEPIVERVVRMRTADPFASDGPGADLCITLKAAPTVDHPRHGRLGTVPFGRVAEHSERGWLLAVGDTTDLASEANGRPIDLASTVTALLGLDRLDRCNGNALFTVAADRARSSA